MSRLKKSLLQTFLLLGMLFQTSLAYAHLMVAQHGTLNIVDNSIFVTLSIPASAFLKIEGKLDHNSDGELSENEFNQHYKLIMSAIQKNVNFLENNEKLELLDMLLSTEKSHHANDKHIDEVIVMGRYALNQNKQDLAFGLTLFGRSEAEQKFKITVKNKRTKRKQKFVITPKNNAVKIKTNFW